MTDRNLEYWERDFRRDRHIRIDAVLKDYRDAVEGYELQITLLVNRLEVAQNLVEVLQKENEKLEGWYPK